MEDTREVTGEEAAVTAVGTAVQGPVRIPRHSRTLSLYLLRGLLLNSSICLLVFEAVQGIVFTVRATEDFTFDFLIIFPVLLRAFGQALSYTVPVSLLLGAALLAGRLNADRETTAFRSFGLSPFQILLPVAVVCAALSALAFHGNQSWMPRLRYANRNVDSLILDNLGYLGEGWNLNFPQGSKSLWIHHYKGPVLEGIFLAIGKDPRGEDDTFISAESIDALNAISYPLYLYAERGSVTRGSEAEEGRLVVDLRDVRVFFDHNLLADGPTDFMDGVWFERLRVSSRFDRTRTKSVKDMPRGELMSVIDGHLAAWRQAEAAGNRDAARESRRQYLGAVTEIHRRLALSLTVLTFPLAAIVLGLYIRSPNRLLPFFVAGTIVPAIFFGLEMVGYRMARSGMAPWALEEAGNFGLMLLSGILLARILRSPSG